jgi:hypothetical protein
MINEVAKRQRPSSITLISLFGIFTGLLGFYLILKTGTHDLSLWQTLFMVFGGIIFLVCGIGLWFMKKWAVYLYAIFAVLDQIFLILIDRWSVMALLIPVIVVYVGYKHLSEMS